VISGSPTKTFRTICWPPELPLKPSLLKGEQTNTSVLYEDWFILKLFRMLEEGTNPDLEVGSFLTEKAAFPHIPPVAGTIEYRRGKGNPMSLAILQGFVRNEGDAWQFTLDSLQRYFENVLTHSTVQIPPLPQKHLLFLNEDAVPLAKETIGPYLSSAHLLGERTAQLHLALASNSEDPAFAPEPFTVMYQNSMYYSMRRSTISTLQSLRQLTEDLPLEVRGDAEQVLAQEKAIVDRFQLIRGRKIRASRIRCHGDYHLGQVLYTGKDFAIIDFEGEPSRPLSERRLKRCPLRDVAGMIRSFHYAAHTALLRHPSMTLRPEDKPALWQWGRFWYVWVSAAFLNSYLNVIQESELVPGDPLELNILLDAYLLDKAIYEIGYELNNRPDWVQVPLRGILHLMEVHE
jgi:maltose alpha-D-glucosyltransferase/alpha-amylase